MARGRSRADQILAVDVAIQYRLPPDRRLCQAALAHRAGLSGAQAGGRAWALRRARVARLPSPRHDVHRSLRIPGLREGDDSPLKTSYRHAAPDACLTRRLSTQGILSQLMVSMGSRSTSMPWSAAMRSTSSTR